MNNCGNSLFGPSSQYIKTNAGDIIATDGSNIRERLILSDLRIPYKQILKSRVILRPGQANYLLNHLGLGDNATFLSIKAVYDSKSTFETDNYVQWTYYDDLLKVYSFSYLMTLTGNSTNRIKQIYLTNPNTQYPVYLDVMVAVLDDNYNFFNDTVNQTATTFTGLEWVDFKTHVVGESVVFVDKSDRPLVFIDLVDINSFTRDGKILYIDSSNFGELIFQFLTESDAAQVQSTLNYLFMFPTTDVNTLPYDGDGPVVYFLSNVGVTGSYIEFDGSTASVPYNTSVGLTFSTSIELGVWGSASVISKTRLGELLISSISDNRDGGMGYIDSNLVIKNSNDDILQSITATGSYILTFDISDIALNKPDSFVNINVI